MCPRCGRREGEPHDGRPLQFVGSFCMDCFLRDKELFKIPKNLSLWKCTRCGRARWAGKWEPYTEEKLIEWVVGKMHATELREYSGTVARLKNNLVVDLELEFEYSGVPVKKGARVLVALDSNACPDCSKQAGGYHEAIVQVRGATDARRQRMVKTLLHHLERLGASTSIATLKEGLDIYVNSRKFAQQAVMETGKTYTVSHTLTGEKMGKRVYRATYCVRLPEPIGKTEEKE